MSGMDGNDHFTATTQNGDDAGALVTATQALAYEQRTANLIAVTETLTIRARFGEAQVNELLDQITARLGLNTKETTP